MDSIDTSIFSKQALVRIKEELSRDSIKLEEFHSLVAQIKNSQKELSDFLLELAHKDGKFSTSRSLVAHKISSFLLARKYCEANIFSNQHTIKLLQQLVDDQKKLENLWHQQLLDVIIVEVNKSRDIDE